MHRTTRHRDRLTTTIKRKWLGEIVAGRKRTEYRELKPYWTKKLAAVDTPFELRLINGMTKPAPDVIVTITTVRQNVRVGRYALRIGRILAVKHWNRRRDTPA